MKIAWIGGLDRAEEAYERAAHAAGHRLEVHDGKVGGRRSDGLRRIVERADLVVVLTAINSHGAVEIARRAARENGIPFVLFDRCGIARFRELLTGLDRPLRQAV